jgi:hypothetical protein
LRFCRRAGHITIMSDDTRLRLRILFGPRAMLGPGKAELLEHIRDTGSITAAGQRMGMSYKRATDRHRSGRADPLPAYRGAVA